MDSLQEPRTQKQEGHAVVTGSPGHGARSSGLLRVLWPIPLLFLVVGVIIGSAAPYRMPLAMAAGSVLVLSGLIVVLSVWSGRRLKRYLKGAEGEEMVARALGFLPHDYHVFHSVWLPGVEAGPRDVDHVVVGPTGVFALETKNWNGQIEIEQDRVLVDGRAPSRPPLQQVYRAARELRQLLDGETNLLVKVCPVLCFAKGDAEIEASAADVLVCDGGNLVDLLQRARGEQLSSEKIERIVEFLEARR